MLHHHSRYFAAVVGVLAILLLAGCPPSGGGTPRPTAEETEPAETRAAETEPGEPTPAETDAGDGFPNADEEHLLAHIPTEFRDDCGETDFGVVGIATIGCGIEAAGGEISITYNLFESEEDMYESYDTNLEFMGVERDAGSCGGDDWPGEGTYNIGGEDVGRIACTDFGGQAFIISWTDETVLIKGYAEGFGVDQDAFYEWWATESGPLPEPEAGD